MTNKWQYNLIIIAASQATLLWRSKTKARGQNMASSQERLWGPQDSPQFSWQGNPGWVLGCQGCLATLPCPRVTSNGQLPSQLALTWVSLAVPDMVLGSHDRLQPSRHISPPLSALKHVLPAASGGSLPSSGPLPDGTLLFQRPSALVFGFYSKADTMLSALHSLGGRTF